MGDDRTTLVQACLERLRAGDEAAREELIRGACDRLGELTRVMLRDYGRLRRWEETDDVLQSALMRLYRSLGTVAPESARDFYRLATLQIRRELIDLTRHHYGPEGAGRKHASVEGESGVPDPAGDPDDDPGRLSVWSEFHEQAEALPEEEREVFDLVWYQGMTHDEAARVLGVSTKTVQRRWHGACLRLHERLGGALPGG